MSADHNEALERLLSHGRNLVALDRENAMREWKRDVDRILSECPDGTRWKAVRMTLPLARVLAKPRIIRSPNGQWCAHSPAYPFRAVGDTPAAAYRTWNNALTAFFRTVQQRQVW